MPAGDADSLAVLAWSAAHGASHLWIEGPLKADGLVDDDEMLMEKVLGTLTRVLSAAGSGRKP